MTNIDQSGHRIESLQLDTSYFGKETILYVNQLDVPKTLSLKTIEETKDESTIVESSTDLVTGVYEGGFKIWECTYDLLSYLSELANSKSLNSTCVLDLGCGSGVLGIYCAIHGAKQVTFQDYNAEVVKGVTIPNYIENIHKQSDISCTPFFFSGPWDTFQKCASNHEKCYDLIVTSETIYNTQHYSTLLEIFDFFLSSKGKVLLAAKVNYFGVGGGLRQFEKAISGNTKTFCKWSYSTVKIEEDNVKREILEIKRKTE